MTIHHFDFDTVTRDYGDFRAEAQACRERCALFDFSFMARARIDGEGALEALARLQPRAMTDLPPGRIRYALRLDDAGCVTADLTVWNIGGGAYEVMSGRHMDVTDLAALASPGTRVEDLTHATCVYALQGPDALHTIAPLTDGERLHRLPYFCHADFSVAGADCRIARLGYTGEPGFEIVVPREYGPALWEVLARKARPAGFAAADCLRIEAGLILFLNECTLGPTPEELGLSRFAPGIERAPRMRLVCFKAGGAVRPVIWRPPPGTLRPPRPGSITVTSACQSTLTDALLGLGFVHPLDAVEGRCLRDPSGTFSRIALAPLPFYDPGKRRPREPWPPIACSRPGD